MINKRSKERQGRKRSRSQSASSDDRANVIMKRSKDKHRKRSRSLSVSSGERANVILKRSKEKHGRKRSRSHSADSDSRSVKVIERSRSRSKSKDRNVDEKSAQAESSTERSEGASRSNVDSNIPDDFFDKDVATSKSAENDKDSQPKSKYARHTTEAEVKKARARYLARKLAKEGVETHVSTDD